MAQVVLQKVTRGLAVSDTVVLAATLAAVYWARFGLTPTWETADYSGILHLSLSPAVQTGLMLVFWIAVLMANRSRDYRIIGSESTEYKRVAMAGLLVPVFMAFAALLFKVDVPRLYIASAIISGTLALLANRWFWRQWLIRKRQRGQYLTRVALLGPRDQIEALARKMKANGIDGYSPAVLIPDTDGGSWFCADGEGSFPQRGFESNLVVGLQAHQCQALLVVGSQILNDHKVKRIAWCMEGSGIDLVVVSPLKDVGTHRLEVRPVAGTPVFMVEVPKFEGWRHLVKGSFDLVTGFSHSY